MEVESCRLPCVMADVPYIYKMSILIGPSLVSPNRAAHHESKLRGSRYITRSM